MNNKTPYSDELYHHGVKGMHWGVITKKPSSSGRSRAKTSNKASSLLEKYKMKKALKNGKSGSSKISSKEVTPENLEEYKRQIVMSRSPKKLYENANLFSDKELQNAYLRLQVQQNINKMIPKEQSAVDKYIARTKKVSEVINTTVDFGNKAIDAYNLGSDIVNFLTNPSFENAGHIAKTQYENRKNNNNKPKNKPKDKKADNDDNDDDDSSHHKKSAFLDMDNSKTKSSNSADTAKEYQAAKAKAAAEEKSNANNPFMVKGRDGWKSVLEASTTDMELRKKQEQDDFDRKVKEKTDALMEKYRRPTPDELIAEQASRTRNDAEQKKKQEFLDMINMDLD